MAQFVAGGGVDATLERLINGLALEEFGERQGMVVSKRAIDGQIASIPGCRAPTASSTRRSTASCSAQRKLTEARRARRPRARHDRRVS